MSPGVLLAEPKSNVGDTVPFHTHLDGTGSHGRARVPGPHTPGLYGFESNKPAAEPGRSPAEELQYIRQHLCLNMSDLALLLGVSRPTAYAWLDGDEPKEDNYHSIVRLSRIAEQFERLHLANLEKLLRRPVFDGRSLLDKLKASEEIGDCIPVLQNLASKEASARSRLKGSGKSPDNQGLSNLSTPIYEPG